MFIVHLDTWTWYTLAVIYYIYRIDIDTRSFASADNLRTSQASHLYNVETTCLGACLGTILLRTLMMN